MAQQGATPASFGFPRSARLTTPRDYAAVLRRPEAKYHSKTLRIRARANRMHGARLGLIVAKRVVPRAHDRNRHKRVCREQFRLARSQLPAVDLVVQVLAPMTNRALVEALRTGLIEIDKKIANSDP